MKTNTQILMIAILFMSISLQAQDSLFISELTDPADDYSGRFIELYNSGKEAIDFDSLNFYLSRQSNGGNTWGEVRLTGAVAPGETFVIGTLSFESVYGFVPDMATGILTGNGNDPYCLFRNGDHITGVLTDLFGVIDVDGTGELWEYTDSRAIRDSSVLTANTVWNVTEWEIAAANVADGDPGIHYPSSEIDTLPSSDNYVLSIQNDTIKTNQSFELSVMVSELTGVDNIIAYQFDVDYDSLALEYTAYSLSGTIAEGGTIVTNTSQAGKISLAYMNSASITGTGNILRLQFNSLRPDTTEVFLSNAFLNNTQIIDLRSAAIIILENDPPTARINFNDTINRFADTLIITANFSESMSADIPINLTFSGAVNISGAEMTRLNDTIYNYSFPVPKANGDVNLVFSSGVDLAGNDLVSEPSSGAIFTIIAFVPGDVNDDGMVQAFDAALTLQYSVGLDPLSETDPLPWEPWRDSTANVDGTNGINAYDAGLILQYSIGLISDFQFASKKSSSIPEVNIFVEDNYIVFESYGEMLGLNLSVSDENMILGIPEILPENYMSAFNISDSSYQIGICTASPLPDGTPFMKIPFNKSGSVTFNMIVNTIETNLSLDVSVGMSEQSGDRISIYPNPADEWINIGGLTGPVRAGIYNIHGQQIIDKSEVINGKINISYLSSGLYIIFLETNNGVIVERFLVR